MSDIEPGTKFREFAETFGPYEWLGGDDPPSDEVIFECLDRFAVAYHNYPSATGREVVRAKWVEFLRPMMPDSWRVVDRVIKGSAVSVCCTNPVLEADRKKLWKPRLIGDMLDDPKLQVEAEWVVPEVAARGVVTLFAGHGKSGKTTFLAEMVACIAQGQSFLGRSTTKTKVLWLDLEQNEALTTAKFRALDARDLPVYVGTGTRQRFTVEELTAFIATEDIGVLVIDSLTKFWQLEDSASDVQVTREIGVIMEIARTANVAIVVIHHTRKSGGGGEDLLDVAGSYAVLGTVDIVIRFKRDTANGDNARILKTIGRYGSGSGVVTFADGRYSEMGDPEALAAERLTRAVIDALTDEPQDAKDIAKEVKKSPGRSRMILNAAFEQGTIRREGAGKRGNPYLYYREKRYPSGPIIGPGQQTETISVETVPVLVSDDDLEGRYSELGSTGEVA